MNQNNLKEYGIDVGLLMSGLFGAILLTSKDTAVNLTRTISSLIGGAASANYLTPIVVNVTKLDNTHYHYGIAFLLGFLGLRGIEYFSRKIIPESAHKELHESAQKTAYSYRRRKPRKRNVPRID
jgi:hypothetical protein